MKKVLFANLVTNIDHVFKCSVHGGVAFNFLYIHKCHHASNFNDVNMLIILTQQQNGMYTKYHDVQILRH